MVSNKSYPAIATSTVAGIAPEYRSELIEATNEWALDNKSEYWEEGYFDLERFENDYVNEMQNIASDNKYPTVD